MENLELYIRNHESSLDGVIGRKLDRSNNNSISNGFISSRIVSNINKSIQKDCDNSQRSVQYKYHSNRPQRSQNSATASISRIGGSHGKSTIPKEASSNPTLAFVATTYNNSIPQCAVDSPFASLGSIEKQLEDFSFRLNSLKMKRTLQLQQLHKLILTDIAIEDTAYYGNETDNAIQQADEEYHHFLSMGQQTFHTPHSTDSSIADGTDIVELPSEWNQHANSGRTATLQNLLRELDAEKNRSMKAKSLDDLLGYQTD